MFWNEFRIHKTSKFVLLLMKSRQSNFNLRLPSSYLVRSYLITTVLKNSAILLKYPIGVLFGVKID